MKYDYVPSLRDLRKSLTRRSKEYLWENTLHGIPYFVDRTRPKWERITWFILTTLSVVATFIIIITIWNKFETNPTLTGLDTETEDVTVDFPQLLICFDWPELIHQNLSESEEKLLSQLYHWKSGETIIHTDDNERNNFYDTFQQMSPDCGSAFQQCSTTMQDETKQTCGDMLEVAMTTVGVCCKFHYRKLRIDDMPAQLTFSSPKTPFRLYALKKEETSPIREEICLVEIDFPTILTLGAHITYTDSQLRTLSISQRKCHYLDEGPSYVDCLQNCLIDRLLKECKCLPWFLLSMKNSVSECSVIDYTCINDQMKIQDERCSCNILCDFTAYECQNLKRSNDDVNTIEIASWPKARYKREIRFGLLNLIVSFGGIAGLFLGYSLLTTLELLYYFTLRTYCGSVMTLSRNKCNIRSKFVTKIRVGE